jgi:hypothetical protein
MDNEDGAVLVAMFARIVGSIRVIALDLISTESPPFRAMEEFVTLVCLHKMSRTQFF